MPYLCRGAIPTVSTSTKSHAEGYTHNTGDAGRDDTPGSDNRRVLFGAGKEAVKESRYIRMAFDVTSGLICWCYVG